MKTVPMMSFRARALSEANNSLEENLRAIAAQSQILYFAQQFPSGTRVEFQFYDGYKDMFLWIPYSETRLRQVVGLLGEAFIWFALPAKVTEKARRDLLSRWPYDLELSEDDADFDEAHQFVCMADEAAAFDSVLEELLGGVKI